MLNDIQYDRSHECHVHIMPWHTPSLEDGDSVRGIVIHVLEVHYSSVVVILAWEECKTEVGGMGVC